MTVTNFSSNISGQYTSCCSHSRHNEPLTFLVTSDCMFFLLLPTSSYFCLSFRPHPRFISSKKISLTSILQLPQVCEGCCVAAYTYPNMLFIILLSYLNTLVIWMSSPSMISLWGTTFIFIYTTCPCQYIILTYNR